MPSFPSYYLNNLERKRQRSADLREGLDKGMAGVLGGVDRLAQMQAALDEKGLRAEALKHGREIEAANQNRADQRFAWEGEDRARKNAQSDQKYWLELQKNATQGNAALGGGDVESPSEDAAEPGEESGETSSDVLAKMQGYLRGEDASGEKIPTDVDTGETLSPDASDILLRLKTSMDEPVATERPAPTSGFAPKPLKAAPKPAPAPTGPTTKEQIEAERLGKAKADRLLAERKVQEMQRDPALANAPPTILQFWGNVKGTAEQMRNLGKEVTPDDFSLAAKAQSQMPTIAQSDRVRRVTSMIDRIVQRAGVSMEGGKLAEGDISRYRAMLMNAMDSYDGFTAATQEIAAELDKKIADEQAMFRQGSPAASGAPAADPQAAFLKTATDLAKQLGRKPTKEELQDAMRAAGVLE